MGYQKLRGRRHKIGANAFLPLNLEHRYKERFVASELGLGDRKSKTLLQTRLAVTFICYFGGRVTVLVFSFFFYCRPR